MKWFFMWLAITDIIAIVFILITKDRGGFFQYNKPIYKMHFLEICACLFVLYFLVWLTIPTSVKRIFLRQ